jgi:uncharacterized membrane protein YvbJ
LYPCGAKIEPSSKFCPSCGRATSLAAAPAADGSSSKARKKTSKKKIAGIVILVTIGIFGALIAIGLSLSSITITTTPGAVVNQTQQTEDRIARLLGNDPNRINDPQWRQVAMDVLRTENMDNPSLVIYILYILLAGAQLFKIVTLYRDLLTAPDRDR